MGKSNATIRYVDDRSALVNQVWNEIVKRPATPQEMSKYRTLGRMTLEGIAATLYIEELKSDSTRNYYEMAKKEKTPGVSLVAPYNKQCGISTYTENLYSEIRKLTVCNVLSDNTRNREEKSTEDGVISCWASDFENSYNDIVKHAFQANNNVIHFQHEFGIFKNNDILNSLVSDLKKFGFKVIITFHTVPSTNQRHTDWMFKIPNLCIVHSEFTAHRIYQTGISTVTVIPHGTEAPLQYDRNECRNWVKQFIGLDDGDVLATSIGFISINKRQLETMKAASIAAKKHPNFKFILAGSAGRRSYDIDYVPKLQDFENSQIKVVTKFLTKEEIAKFMIASDFGVYGYEPTNYSTSGISHLVMTYGVPTVTSRSLILEDLGESISIKAESIDEFSVGIERLINDSNLRKSLASAAYYKGLGSRWDKTAAAHLNVYQHIGGWVK